MKILLFAFAFATVTTFAMDVTTVRNYNNDKAKTEFLNRLAACNVLEHAHCQRIKAHLPIAYNIMCQKPQDSFADFLCDLISTLPGNNSSNVIVESLECHGGNIPVEFTIFHRN